MLSCASGKFMCALPAEDSKLLEVFFSPLFDIGDCNMRGEIYGTFVPLMKEVVKEKNLLLKDFVSVQLFDDNKLQSIECGCKDLGNISHCPPEYVTVLLFFCSNIVTTNGYFPCLSFPCLFPDMLLVEPASCPFAVACRIPLFFHGSRYNCFRCLDCIMSYSRYWAVHCSTFLRESSVTLPLFLNHFLSSQAIQFPPYYTVQPELLYMHTIAEQSSGLGC